MKIAIVESLDFLVLGGFKIASFWRFRPRCCVPFIIKLSGMNRRHAYEWEHNCPKRS